MFSLPITVVIDSLSLTVDNYRFMGIQEQCLVWSLKQNLNESLFLAGLCKSSVTGGLQQT